MNVSRSSGAALVAVVAAAAGAAGGFYWRDIRESALFGKAMATGTTPAEMASPATQNGQAQPLGDQRALKAKPLFRCGMHPWIIMDHPGTCPICHMTLTPYQQDDQTNTTAANAVLYYWDPSAGESSITGKPGKTAAGNSLIPVYKNEATGGPSVSIDPAVVQNMGVQTAQVTIGALNKTVRTVGELQLPDDAAHDVSLKINGWVEKLYADKMGMHVAKGEPLFDLYSPDLQVAQEELIAARKAWDALDPKAAAAVRKESQDMLSSARRKLELWDVPEKDIDAISSEDHARRSVTFRSPAEGHLEDKMIVEGSAVQAGMKLLRIADHGALWLEAQVYEGQLPLVALGQTADATLDAVPGKTFTGKVIFIDPHVDPMNRTTAVRVALANPGEALRPGMYATVEIHTRPLDSTVLVPRSAIIDTGTRQIAFVTAGEGHFSPRLIHMGLGGDDGMVQITQGLAPGETVVTSGQFLMDVESRTQEAIEKLRSGNTSPEGAANPLSLSMPVGAP